METRHVAINVDKLWDLVRDAYEEGKDALTDSPDWEAPFSKSMSYKQVIEWLEWYWQAKNDVGDSIIILAPTSPSISF